MKKLYLLLSLPFILVFLGIFLSQSLSISEKLVITGLISAVWVAVLIATEDIYKINATNQ
ncbi:hypothetical protein LCGC14_2559510 [marine sediment metagenome]|uniref:Uncharacterized protein n=1 Tax=marine sediment metagenome TaxID=412755 RepID=A0A0F9AKE9_9ZZZZ